MKLAIQYARPASGHNDGEIFGLDVAVNNLLSAYFLYGTAEPYICRPTDLPSFEHFKNLAAAAGRDPATCVGLDPRYPKQNMGSVDVLFCPDPLTANLVWQRQQVGGRGFATCGVVHTMSGERIARAVGDLCFAPSDGSDALICPSEAIRDAVQNLWGIQTEYINHRFGGSFACPVQTPVIPLGIDCAKFSRLTSADKRAAQRQALGVNDDDVVILFVGRLSFATKAHPLPLFMAAERAAQQTKKKLRLVMFGYFKPADMEPHFRNLAKDFCPSAAVEFVMNNDPRFPDGLWAGADMFVSLSDNVQESFGLTPIEAMASGLPAIITDWNGYRGGVRNGVDGHTIPTRQPPASAGMDIATYYYNQGNYGMALMAAAQSTSLDIARCAEAIATLANDGALRQQFAANGRARAQDVYDWSRIIPQYEVVWRNLTLKRASVLASGSPQNWPAAHPAYVNPWAMFAAFPTDVLKPDDRLNIIMAREGIAAIFQHEMNYFVPELLAPKETLIDLAEAIRTAGNPSIGDVLASFPVEQHPIVWRCIGWMLKHGVAVLI